jgi:hypothetical protein
MVMHRTTNFTLALSIKPYVGDIATLGLISVLAIAALVRSHQLPILGLVFLIWLVLASDIYQKTHYRVTWESNSIRRVTANGYETVIPIEKVARVAYETSKLRINLMRPTRRLTIYATGGEHIDVSIKHFVATDIHRLLQCIHEARPDLDMPSQWLT